MLFQREGIWGEEGSRRDSSTPNQGSKPWIMEKKGPKSEITEPISEPPPGSHRSVTLLMPFQAPSEGRQHFTRAETEIPRAFPNPSRNCSRTGWHSTPHSAVSWKNDGVQEMESSPFPCSREHHQTLWWRGRVTAWTGEGAILLFAC